MSIIQLVPVEKGIVDPYWWKKTLFYTENEEDSGQELAGCEYVFNFSMGNYYLGNGISDVGIHKVLVEKKLISEEILNKFNREFMVLTTQNRMDNVNLEFKFGKPPFVVKMNCHLHPSPKGFIVPPKGGEYMKVKEILTIDELLDILPLKTFLSKIAETTERLKTMDETNCEEFGYMVSSASAQYVKEQKRKARRY